MKKTFLLSVLVIAFGVSFPQAQQGDLDAVITKFKSDNRSFEEFVLLGRMLCYGKVSGMPVTKDGTDKLYLNTYVQLYNTMGPFTRLFDEKAIIAHLEAYYLLKTARFERYDTKARVCDRGSSRHYNKIAVCDTLFAKNDEFEKRYRQFVSDKSNYLVPTKSADTFDWSEIEAFRKDYLENYYMRGLIDGPPYCK
ncbi:MAG: hypothetical protein FWB85_09675 [Chitinispirillia bacterium]|nr:hypothetical protein [Chitinispirillia bacterium]MCL2242449.1 hypothetical protein [Chitinispirillia bacterium]